MSSLYRRVADPSGVDPDPDPTVKEKPGTDPTLENQP